MQTNTGLEIEVLELGPEPETQEAAVARLKLMYDQREALRRQMADVIAQAFPEGMEINFYHGDHRQTGIVVRHPIAGADEPEVIVENINTGTHRRLTLWHIFDEPKYKAGEE